MDFLNNRNLVLASFLGGLICVFLSYQFSNPYLLTFSTFSFLFAIFIFRFGYFLIPFISSSSKITLKDGSYSLTPSQDILLKKTKDGYYATTYLGIELKESTTYKGSENKTAMMEMFERAISSLNYVVKISLILSHVDVSDYIEKLEQKRSLLEHRKSQTSSKKVSDTKQLDRDISSITHQIELLKTGQKPMQVVAYASTTSFSPSKEQAIQNARARTNEIKAVLSNALFSKVEPLHANHLLACFSWERQTPQSIKQIQDDLL
jgi:hypothetical protein